MRVGVVGEGGVGEACVGAADVVDAAGDGGEGVVGAGCEAMECASVFWIGGVVDGDGFAGAAEEQGGDRGERFGCVDRGRCGWEGVCSGREKGEEGGEGEEE